MRLYLANESVVVALDVAVNKPIDDSDATMIVEEPPCPFRARIMKDGPGRGDVQFLDVS